MTAKAHSPYSASGAERWFNCPGSVALSWDQPDRTSPAAEQGTKAHEVLEIILKTSGTPKVSLYDQEMLDHGVQAAAFVINLQRKHEGSELLCETRADMSFIEPSMFGTLDVAIVQLFGVLYIIDYKYGRGHRVSPKDNLQMIFYAIAIARKYKWNFKTVRLYIVQPRIGDGEPSYHEMTILELKRWVKVFKKAVERVKLEPKTYKEGDWCYFCKGKHICPLKKDRVVNDAKRVFG